MCWLLVIIAFFFGIGLAGSWELGIWILFLASYPMILLFLSQVGVISYSPILIPIAVVPLAGVFYRLIEENQKSREEFKRILQRLEELEERDERD